MARLLVSRLIRPKLQTILAVIAGLICCRAMFFDATDALARGEPSVKFAYNSCRSSGDEGVIIASIVPKDRYALLIVPIMHRLAMVAGCFVPTMSIGRDNAIDGFSWRLRFFYTPRTDSCWLP